MTYDTTKKDQYGKSMENYKADYAAAQARGDAVAMAKANAGANAIRVAQGGAAESASGAINNAANGVTMSVAKQAADGWDVGKADASYVKPAQSYNPASNRNYEIAMDALNEIRTSVPTYKNSYEAQIQDLYDQIVNRDKFKYDLNTDMLYQQYAQQYANGGRMAMQDTMGQAAALTGGYGSTYGQAVGQQQYDAYLQKLNDVVPELYNQAYGRWRDEGNDMLQHYSMLGDLADDEYRKYLDDYSHWMADRDYYQQVAGVEYDRGYQDWADQLGNYYADYDRRMNEANNDREYQLALDKFNYQKEQDAQQLALKEAAANASNGTDGGKSVKATKTAAPTDKTVDNPSPKKKATYTSSELLDAAAAGMTKAQIEEVLKNRGINVNDPAVQSDIKWALSK